MSPELFDKLVNDRLEKCKATLSSKAKEYAPGEDRFHNFYRAASILNISPAKALVGFMTKHLVSVLDLLDDPVRLQTENWEEKIGDLISYLLLLDAMVREPLK